MFYYRGRFGFGSRRGAAEEAKKGRNYGRILVLDILITRQLSDDYVLEFCWLLHQYRNCLLISPLADSLNDRGDSVRAELHLLKFFCFLNSHNGDSDMMRMSFHGTLMTPNNNNPGPWFVLYCLWAVHVCLGNMHYSCVRKNNLNLSTIFLYFCCRSTHNELEKNR